MWTVKEVMKLENRTEYNPRIPGAVRIPQGADPAQAEEAGLCSDCGAGAGIHRGRIYGRDSVHRSCSVVLPTGRPDIKIERLHNGWQASKHSHNNSITY